MTTLLLIEDDQVLRENTRDLLEVFGFECLVAQRGEAGLDLLEYIKPDLIICDVMMPGFDGYQTKQEINKDPTTRKIPFIFLTGKSATEDIAYGFAIGACAYIIKPFKIKDLVDAITTHIPKTI